MKYGIVCNNNSAIVLPINDIETYLYVNDSTSIAGLPLSSIISGSIHLEVAPENLIAVDCEDLNTALNLAAGLVCSNGNGVITYYDTKVEKGKPINKTVYHVDNFCGLTNISEYGDGSDQFDNEPLKLK